MDKNTERVCPVEHAHMRMAREERDMELTGLGFDEWFQEKRNELGRPDLQAARVTRVDRERWLVRNAEREVHAEATGRLLFAADSAEAMPCAGDWVLVEYYNDGALAIIHDVLPRRTFLRRKTAGKTIDAQMIAANIDVAFIVQSCDGNFNLRRMERYMIMARDGRIEPVVLLSKCDLISRDELAQRVADIARAHIDARVVPFSSVTEEGMPEVRATMERGRTYCLLGSSGVGKTTLLNHLLGREEFAVNTVREKDGRGRHTTVQRQLVALEDSGALLIDTPGMRELGMLAAGDVIDESFSEVHALAEECRFADCTHTCEADCAILSALKTGVLDEARYHGWLKLQKEAAFNEMSRLERREKDRAFGRMINPIKKELKRRKG